MGMPAIFTQTGTGSVIWFADWTLTPFQVAVQVLTSGDVGTSIIEATLDKIDISGTGGGQGSVGLGGGLGTTAANANWVTVAALSSGASFTNWTTPVQAFRATLNASTATSVITIKFLQAGWPS